MKPGPREILCALVARHGPDLCRDVRRCEALLLDSCGMDRREVNVLLAAARARVGADLMAAQAATPRPALLARLTRRLCDDFALTDEAAHWAVESWALALSIEVPEGSTPPPPSPKPPVPPPIPKDLAEVLRTAGNAIALVNPLDGASLVRVPAGSFVMGDDDQKDNPRRRVFLDGFWLYKTPVTVAQFLKFCAATGHATPDAPPWGWQGEHPVVNVSWSSAMAYASWAGAHLPTETQWEKAARGADGKLYPWGNGWDAARCVHSAGAARSSTQPCGAFPTGVSPCGALDMAGNVWEWCADWYSEAHLRNASGSSPQTAPGGDRRVLRGGSWNDTMPFIYRTSMRFRYDPQGRFASFGFRCAVPEG